MKKVLVLFPLVFLSAYLSAASFSAPVEYGSAADSTSAESSFINETLNKAPKILPGTILALNDSQFSETRYEFTSEYEESNSIC